MQKICLILFSLAALANLYSQPKLKVAPNNIKFEDLFDRLENIYLINEGDQTLTIESINYNYNFYFVRFDSYASFPFYIDPGDTVKMDCILSGYYLISSSDTTDTMYVQNNGINPVEDIKVDIGFYDDDRYGTITGNISSEGSAVPNANVFVLFEGNYILNIWPADSNGNYSINLPPGSYTLAAEKDQHYVSFFDGRNDPFSAAIINLYEDSVFTANIDLTKMINTGYSVSGSIFDSLSSKKLRKGIVVVRRGSHTPSKISASSQENFDDQIYTAIVNEDGSYSVENITDPNYYYIQSFSDYYVPTYYSDNNSSPFWQSADSLLVNGDLTDKNIFMPRDSSIGGGSIGGSVTINKGTESLVSDAVVLARSKDYNILFNYAFVKDNGSFEIKNLPYGRYNLIAQKIGFNDAISSELQITPGVTSIDDVFINFNITSVNEPGFQPDKIILYQNYPNPFNPSTTIEFYLPERSDIKLKISNLLGEEITELYSGFLTEGTHKFSFNASNLSSGLYFVTLLTNTNHLTRKILLLR